MHGRRRIHGSYISGGVCVSMPRPKVLVSNVRYDMTGVISASLVKAEFLSAFQKISYSVITAPPRLTIELFSKRNNNKYSKAHFS